MWSILRVSLNYSHLHGLQKGALLLTTTGVGPFSALASGLSLADYAATVSGESLDVCLRLLYSMYCWNDIKGPETGL